jgi:hypothetical protein
MASNRKLAAEAADLAEELDTQVTTDGLNNKDLSALVSDLKAKKKDAELQTQADSVPLEEEDKRAPSVYVAVGKVVTSKIGVLGEGRVVEAKHFAGGQKTLDNLIERGHCVKVD